MIEKELINITIEYEFILAVLGCLALAATFAFILSVCAHLETKGIAKMIDEKNTELEERALEAESDLTEARIKAVLQSCRISRLKRNRRFSTRTTKGLKRQNQKLCDLNEEVRQELNELYSLQADD